MTSTQGNPILTNGEITRPLYSEAEIRQQRAERKQNNALSCPYRKRVKAAKEALAELTDKTVYAFLVDYGDTGTAICEVNMEPEDSEAEALDALILGEHCGDVLAVYRMNLASGSLCDVSSEFAERWWTWLAQHGDDTAANVTSFIRNHHPDQAAILAIVKEADRAAAAEDHALRVAMEG